MFSLFLVMSKTIRGGIYNGSATDKIDAVEAGVSKGSSMLSRSERSVVFGDIVLLRMFPPSKSLDILSSDEVV